MMEIETRRKWRFPIFWPRVFTSVLTPLSPHQHSFINIIIQSSNGETMARAKGTSRQSNGSAQDEAETPYRLNENEHGNLKDLKDDTPFVSGYGPVSFPFFTLHFELINARTEEEFADKTKFRRYK